MYNPTYFKSDDGAFIFVDKNYEAELRVEERLKRLFAEDEDEEVEDVYTY